MQKRRVLRIEKREAPIATLEEQASPLRSALLEAQGTKNSAESKSHAKAQRAQSTSSSRLRTKGTGVKSYFELAASFAQRIMAIGKENKITQRIFSSNIRFLGSLYGSKLILTILHPSFLCGFLV